MKSDECFKMTKNTFFHVAVESRLKNVFFVILKHTSNFVMIKISPEVEEPTGRSVLFLKFCQIPKCASIFVGLRCQVGIQSPMLELS